MDRVVVDAGEVEGDSCIIEVVVKHLVGGVLDDVRFNLVLVFVG